MANTFFQFKQFTVNQAQCGMKVTTDACLFGAWVANFLHENPTDYAQNFKVLDIGTGTGLLSLMLAQINPNINIDAVEIDHLASIEASENFNASPFNKQIQSFHSDIKTFYPFHTNGYQFIITNPPFFEDDLKSPLHNRNLAMHSLSLSLEELVLEIKRLLSFKGRFAILLPYHRTDYFIKLTSKAGFKLLASLFVKQTLKHPFFRSMLLFENEDVLISKDNVDIKVKSAELVIRENNEYSASFNSLLMPYYLKL